MSILKSTSDIEMVRKIEVYKTKKIGYNTALRSINNIILLQYFMSSGIGI